MLEITEREENQLPQEPALSVDEAAFIMKVDRRTYITWMKQGVAPGVKIGATWRIDRAIFEEWYERTMRQGGNVPYSRRTQAS